MSLGNWLVAYPDRTGLYFVRVVVLLFFVLSGFNGVIAQSSEENSRRLDTIDEVIGTLSHDLITVRVDVATIKTSCHATEDSVHELSAKVSGIDDRMWIVLILISGGLLAFLLRILWTSISHEVVPQAPKGLKR